MHLVKYLYCVTNRSYKYLLQDFIYYYLWNIFADLYGLIHFLGLEPYSNQDAWSWLLFVPYVLGNSKPLLDILGKIMWRTEKKDVLDQVYDLIVNFAHFQFIDKTKFLFLILDWYSASRDSRNMVRLFGNWKFLL